MSGKQNKSHIGEFDKDTSAQSSLVKFAHSLLFSVCTQVCLVSSAQSATSAVTQGRIWNPNAIPELLQ